MMSFLSFLIKTLKIILRAVLSFGIIVITVFAILVAATYIILPHSADKSKFPSYIGYGPELDISIIMDSSGQRQGRRVVVLNRPWHYITSEFFEGFGDRPVIIPVSQYFVSDFASVPFYVRPFISQFGKHAEAAVLHDWLYAIGPGSVSKKKARKNADLLFYEAMIHSGVWLPARRLMFLAVRIGGAGSFGEDTEWKSERFYMPSIRTWLADNRIETANSVVVGGYNCLIAKPEKPGILLSQEEIEIIVSASKAQRDESVRLRRENGDPSPESSYERYAKNRTYLDVARSAASRHFDDRWKEALLADGCRAILWTSVGTRPAIDDYDERGRLTRLNEKWYRERVLSFLAENEIDDLIIEYVLFEDAMQQYKNARPIRDPIQE